MSYLFIRADATVERKVQVREVSDETVNKFVLQRRHASVLRGAEATKDGLARMDDKMVHRSPSMYLQLFNEWLFLKHWSVRKARAKLPISIRLHSRMRGMTDNVQLTKQDIYQQCNGQKASARHLPKQAALLMNNRNTPSLAKNLSTFPAAHLIHECR